MCKHITNIVDNRLNILDFKSKKEKKGCKMHPQPAREGRKCHFSRLFLWDSSLSKSSPPLSEGAGGRLLHLITFFPFWMYIPREGGVERGRPWRSKRVSPQSVVSERQLICTEPIQVAVAGNVPQKVIMYSPSE